MSKDAFFSSLLREASVKRRKENIIAVVPEGGFREGGFRGNTKAAFLIFSRLIKEKQYDWKVCFISSDRDKSLLNKHGFFCLSTSGDKGEAADLLLRAKYVIFGNHDWQDIDSWFWQSCRFDAIKIQLWHGIPAKQVAYEVITQQSDMYKIASWAYEILGYDYCVTESPAVCSMYSKAFPSSTLLPFGSSRNDLLIRDDYSDMLFLGYDTYLVNHLNGEKSSKRIILVAPTFREPNYKDRKFYLFITLAEKLAQEKDVCVVIKLHPWHVYFHEHDLRRFKHLEVLHRNIIVVDPESDIHPLLKLVDTLVTDYSSVAYDFVITNKPIIYFRPDHDQYWESRDKPTSELYRYMKKIR